MQGYNAFKPFTLIVIFMTVMTRLKPQGELDMGTL